MIAHGMCSCTQQVQVHTLKSMLGEQAWMVGTHFGSAKYLYKSAKRELWQLEGGNRDLGPKIQCNSSKNRSIYFPV